MPCGASARGLPAPPAASLLQADRRSAAAGTALAHALALCCLAAAADAAAGGCRHADRGQQLLLPFLAKHNTRSSKPIIRTNNLALIPLLGNHRGATSYAQRKNKKTKIPDSQKMFIVVRRLVRKIRKNTKLRIEIVLPREIVYPCFLADP